MSPTVRKNRADASAGTSAHPPARFRDLLVSEWIKLFSLRSTYWVLTLGSLAVIAVNVQATLARRRLIADWSVADKTTYNWMNDALGQAPYLLLILAAATIGALSMAGEYSTGLIRTTFAAVPARRSVVAAKVIVLSAVMLAVGAVIATGSVVLTQVVLAGEGTGFSLTSHGVPTAVAASAVALPACAMVGLGIGVLVRHTAASVVSVFAVLIVLPELTSGTNYDWVVHVNHAMPWSAWLTLRNTPIREMMPPEFFPWPIGATWLVLAVWPLVGIVVATVVANRRDL